MKAHFYSANIVNIEQDIGVKLRHTCIQYMKAKHTNALYVSISVWDNLDVQYVDPR